MVKKFDDCSNDVSWSAIEKCVLSGPKQMLWDSQYQQGRGQWSIQSWLWLSWTPSGNSSTQWERSLRTRSRWLWSLSLLLVFLLGLVRWKSSSLIRHHLRYRMQSVTYLPTHHTSLSTLYLRNNSRQLQRPYRPTLLLTCWRHAAISCRLWYRSSKGTGQSALLRLTASYWHTVNQACSRCLAKDRSMTWQPPACGKNSLKLCSGKW